MALTVSFVFDPAQETAAGNGWTVNNWDDSLDEPVVTTTRYATITAALNGIKALYQADPLVTSYFVTKAEDAVLAANAAAVATQTTTYRTAEGL